MEYLTPWHALGSNSLRLQTELAAEVGSDHPLYGRDMRAVAVRQDCDDVLFVSVDEPQVVAVVHLTWSGRPERDPRWPETMFFASMEDWIERGMMVDHADFCA
jgi:hypothetical protein